MRAVPTRDTLLPTYAGREAGRGSHRTLRRSVAALSTVPLFDGFAKRHLRRLAADADVVEYGAGRPIVEEGQPGEAMFVLLEGRARVARGRRTVAALIPGDFFGELSALDGGPRTASIVAETPVLALRLYRGALGRVIEEEPALALHLLVGLARRLRQVRPRTVL
jgi:CRP-like cAMP-binding protein